MKTNLEINFTESILNKSKSLKVEEKREARPEYLEIVVFQKDLDGWDRVLQPLFGKVVKPAGVSPTPKDAQLTKRFGEIRSNQILYTKNVGNKTLIAMFWPWQDNQLMTLKVAVVAP